MRKVLVRWKIRGAHYIDGVAFDRYPNDEDIVTEHFARKLALTGQVDIIGDPGEHELNGTGGHDGNDY